MIRPLRLSVALVALVVGACRPTAPVATAAAGRALPAGAVRHVVVFKFKPGATAAQIDTLTRAFAALKDSVPGMLAFEHGVNDSPENLNQGFTHVYLSTFESAAARDAYLVHPAHKRFGALVGRLGIWAGGFVVDFTPAP